MTKQGFDPEGFAPVVAKLKPSIARHESVQKQDLDIMGVILDPGPIKNDFYPLDVTYKGIIHDFEGKPSAFLLCSNPMGKTLVQDNVEKARAARQVLPDTPAQAVDIPVAHGFDAGVSWAVYNLNQHLATGRLQWQIQKRRLTPVVAGWLTDVVGYTRSAIPAHEIESIFISPLALLKQDSACLREMTQDIDSAMARAEKGLWQPCTTLAHNDLWRGNIMLAPGSIFLSRSLRIIDWAGSNIRGIPFFDLFKFLQSFTVPKKTARKLIQAHCDALKCSRSDARGYLLAALGELGQNLDQFPHHAYARLVRELYYLACDLCS